MQHAIASQRNIDNSHQICVLEQKPGRFLLDSNGILEDSLLNKRTFKKLVQFSKITLTKLLV